MVGDARRRRNAFTRDRSYGCSRAFACDRGTDRIGAGERSRHRSSDRRTGNRDAGALLVYVARSARLLPAMALLVTGAGIDLSAIPIPN